MNPAQLRLEIQKLCEAFGAAAQTGHPVVINATALTVNAELFRLIPDSFEANLDTKNDA